MKRQRIEVTCAKDEHGRPGVQFFVPDKQLPDLMDALETAADDGDRHAIDQLLVRLDRVIKDAAKHGDDWAARLLDELEEAVIESRRQLLCTAG